MAYKNIKITKGSAGFGGPLIIEPNEHKNKVLCVTGQQISPVAQKIAEMTGCELVDGFKTTVPDDEVAVAVLRRAAHEVANESGQEHLCAYHHHREGYVEVGRVGDESLRNTV